jgi:uncharacterized protein YrzB (UPF0473 family)
MKNIMNICLLLLFSACSSNRVVLDYLEKEMRGNQKLSEYILIKEKEKQEKAFTIMRGVGILKDDKTSVFSGTKFFTNNEMKQIEKQVIRNNDIDEWKKSDFKNISFIIKSNKNDSIFYLKNYISEKKTTYFYSFSEPFFLKNKKLAFFLITKSSTLNSGDYVKSVIMRKEQGKWLVVEEVYNTDL